MSNRYESGSLAACSEDEVTITVAVTGALGRMGSLIIENIGDAPDMELVAAFDIHDIGMPVGAAAGAGDVRVSDAREIDALLADTSPDVLIDFTIADAAVGNVRAAVEHGVAIVLGTTGLEPYQDEIAGIIAGNVPAVIAPNFSVGVNVFWKLLAEAAAYIGDWDIEIVEAHHRHKKDAPSGTAMRAADVISSALGGKELVYGRKGLAPRGDEIGIHAIRGGDIIGDHLVLFAGDGERIEIKHQAHSRQAFAGGA
ncbi:MAG: 4-hydroxy-tetrahydrodipicolinate reductase, partial [Methanosarcinales archaeon]|nr:4-hydroxy-tetrahydrodipicolinate reductase [Methanosarcinales archaeon]